MATAPDQQNTTLTTMSALKQPQQSVTVQETVTMGFGSLQSFELMQRAAKLLASSTLVPKHYQGQLANCVIALNMAGRIGADPLLVMQNLYVVHGNPGWSAQFLIACFNQCGRFSAIRYRWGGTEGQDSWSCRAYAVERSSGEEIVGPVISIALAKKEGWYQKSGSKWQSIPQLMLMYRAAAWLVRTHAPEISMGLQTAEEVHDVFDARKGSDGSYEVTLDSLRAQEPETDEPETAGETVDTETGEVTPAAEPEQTETIPQYDTASAIKALEKCKTAKTLGAAFKDIRADFQATDRELPIEIEARFNELDEHFAEKEKQL